MGAAIAARLRMAHEVVVFDVDVSRSRAVEVESGVIVASALEDLADGTRGLVLSLPTPEASRSVVETLAGHLTPGSIVVETSTVTPDDMLDLARVCAASGLGLVDAAVLSGTAQMRAGTSMLLLGGDDHWVDAARPITDALASRQLRLGGLGSGMAAKVANNAVSHAVMVVLVEAASIAREWGVPPRVLVELLAEEDGGLLRPLRHRLGERIAEGDFTDGMPTEAALKDSVLALRMAETADVPLYALRGAHTPYELAVEEGYARLDYAAIALLWEAWTGRSLRSDSNPEQLR